MFFYDKSWKSLTSCVHTPKKRGNYSVQYYMSIKSYSKIFRYGDTAYKDTWVKTEDKMGQSNTAQKGWLKHYPWVDASAGGVSLPEGIISQAKSVLVLIWFTRYIYFWTLLFINMQLSMKRRFSFIIHRLTDFGFRVFSPFGFLAHRDLKLLAFPIFDFDRTWWRLFQKRVVRIKLDIYVY